jgi:diphthamide biosynthesis protein 2
VLIVENKLSSCIYKPFVVHLFLVSSCCVDEVAAEHYNCDAIVHYGHACLSPTPGKLPVWFVFGRRTLDVDVLIEKVLPMVVSDPSQPILLLYDTIFYHAVNGQYK